MRILVDTNIIISAGLFPNSLVAKIFEHIMTNHDMILCKYTLEELEIVCNRKFPDRKDSLNKFMGEIVYELVDINEIDYTKYFSIRDKNDLPILVSAIKSNADILITGDKDFDDIIIEKPKIMKPKNYTEEYME
jgi:putative PIN family toxin of toxin-antitoxin system